jgi:hypothetical protein
MILVLIDKDSNTYCSSHGDYGGGGFHDDLRLFIPVSDVITTSEVRTQSIVSASVETDGIEHKFWDPSLLGGSKSIKFTSSQGCLFCTCEDGKVSLHPKPPLLICAPVARMWLEQIELIFA